MAHRAERILNSNNLADSKQTKKKLNETGAQMGSIDEKIQMRKSSRYCLFNKRFLLTCTMFELKNKSTVDFVITIEVIRLQTSPQNSTLWASFLNGFTWEHEFFRKCTAHICIMCWMYTSMERTERTVPTECPKNIKIIPERNSTLLLYGLTKGD